MEGLDVGGTLKGMRALIQCCSEDGESNGRRHEKSSARYFSRGWYSVSPIHFSENQWQSLGESNPSFQVENLAS